MTQKHLLIAGASALLLFFSGFRLQAQQPEHCIGVWGGGGYSALFHGISNSKVPGGMGGNIGLGYEFHQKKLMFQGGFEFKCLGSRSSLHGYGETYLSFYPFLDEGGLPLYEEWLLFYKFADYRERQRFSYINIPLMFGMNFGRYYAMAGAKTGLNLSANYRTEARVDLQGMPKQAVGPIGNVGKHDLEEFPLTKEGKLDLGLNVAASLELGVVLDEWLPAGFKTLNNARRTPVSCRAGFFVDYGLLNINRSSTEATLSYPVGDGVQEISLNSLSSSFLSDGKRFRDLYTGLKLTVLFRANRERKPRTPSRPSKTPPPPVFHARVTDAASGVALDAEVSARLGSSSRDVFRKRTDAYGMMAHGLRRGSYNIMVKSAGYSGFRQSVTHSKTDTLHIALSRIPVFFVRVTDAETGANLPAEIAIHSVADDKQAVKLQTDAASGMASAELAAGKYRLSVSSGGYIYHRDEFEFSVSDTLPVALQPIKKDLRVVLNNLFFEFARADVMPESEPALQDLHQFLTANPQVRIHIVGHTDNVGTVSYNMTLSGNRAKAVYDILVLRGIAAARLSYEGKGSGEPASTNDTEEGRAENRRVEFVIK